MNFLGRGGVDMIMEEKITFVDKPQGNEPWDVVVIGSGPAAFTSAIYTTRGAASTLILGGAKWGGQLMLTTNVDNFPGYPEGIQGPELMNKMKTQAERFGAEFVAGDVQSVDFNTKPFKLTTNGDTYFAKSVIIATGADTKWLGVPGEDKLRGRGVSSCAPCDAPFFKDKKVAVVGGGDSAMEEALVLTKYSPQVSIIHRKDELRASQAMQKKVLEDEKIKVIWSTQVVEMLGDKTLSSVRLKTSSSSKYASQIKENIPTEHGGKLLEEKDGEFYWEIPIEGLFVAIGHTPATGIFKDVVALDERNYIRKVEQKHIGNEVEPFNTSTNIKGVFVAGDVHDYYYKQAVTAAGFGCMAGMDALKYLDKPVQSW
jgi:thioredoxin reductase (NADPH)